MLLAVLDAGGILLGRCFVDKCVVPRDFNPLVRGDAFLAEPLAAFCAELNSVAFFVAASALFRLFAVRAFIVDFFRDEVIVRKKRPGRQASANRAEDLSVASGNMRLRSLLFRLFQTAKTESVKTAEELSVSLGADFVRADSAILKHIRHTHIRVCFFIH